MVIGLVGAAGTELKKVTDILRDRLRASGYTIEEVRVSTDIIPRVVDCSQDFGSEFERISALMDAGNQARRESKDNAVLALGVAAKIASDRPDGEAKHRPRHAYIINSLKHPDEVTRLRQIYPEGFYLLGVHSDEKRRHNFLVEDMRLSADQAEQLMQRDEDEHIPHGQRTTDTFHLSDFFVRIDENQDRLKNCVWRILDILYGSPYVTPTFYEYAMFMAFSTALRSCDLSRQVGAVIAREKEIVSTGANDCPQFGGGLYWPVYDKETHEIKDIDGGRDYTRQEDANETEQRKIIDDILRRVDDDLVDAGRLRDALMASRIMDITEYGRMVHAEMEALMSCARNHISARGATLYCTTFPCHNCAKHIVAAGIKRVVYIEPYPKSKAVEFHSDSISLGFSGSEDTVHFEPFVGVGPRRFFDLFSMRLGSGYPLKRKDETGHTIEWKPEDSRLRIQMLPCSYIELELVASSMFNEFRKQKEKA
ncbi:MAG: dCMP deaminase family protein [Planctomycetes bacterium]|nr:dCMP deaminase family protein [Planctomycetota bacterium]